MSDVPAMLKKIKALEATVQERENQLLQQQQQLCAVQVSKRIYGLNDVKTVSTRLRAMRETHVNFCTKYAGGKTTPKTLPTRTRLLEFLNKTIGHFEKEFAEHFAAIATEPEPKQPKKTTRDQ